MYDDRLNILLIEDDPGDATYLREIIPAEERVLFNLTWVDRLQAGLEVLSKGPIDVVLLDLNLPDSEGLETLEKVNALAPSVPVVVLTGHTDQERGVAAVKHGAQDYLIKGQVDRNLLIRALRYSVERMRLSEQTRKVLTEAKEKAEEMNRLKDAFLANMSHEIRTPLAAIIGYAQLLAEKVPEPQRHFIQEIKNSGHRLLNTLNTVLDLSMLEAGTLQLNREVLNVGTVVQQTVQLLEPLARDKGLRLQARQPTAKVEALLDRACLNRILNNLIGNAIKFTVQGEVAVTVRAVEQRVEIEVSDTGIGISEAFKPRLFEAFKQESTGLARSHEGTGLGLAVTKRLVGLIEGKITVESQKGQGSRFTVTFPALATQPDAPARKPGNGLHAAAEELSRKPTRILALDDNSSMLYLLERFLMALRDVEVDTAEDETTALALARRQHYDIALLDINLGVIRTGVDVLHELRRLPEYTTIPAVAVTAYALPGDRERFLEAGFNAYLGKPFTEEQLREVLVETLRA